MDASERSLLERTVADAIADAPQGDAAALDATLAGLGWLDFLAAEPSTAIAILFGALGRANANCTALDDVVAFALGVPPRADLATLLPRFGSTGPPGRFDDDRLRADGLTTARFATAADLLVVTTPRTGVSNPQYVRVTHAGSLEGATRVQGIDPEAALYAIAIDVPASETALEPARWESAVALAQRAVAHQIAGASRAMLDLARTHAIERVQFGRPVAKFQAVRHRLADALVAVEGLDAALGAAADERTPETAAMAKVIAGRTARTVATHCQQVLAGIGFTTDHPFHRYLKRTILLDGLFGSADELTLEIGRRLLDERRVPTLIEL